MHSSLSSPSVSVPHVCLSALLPVTLSCPPGEMCLPVLTTPALDMKSSLTKCYSVLVSVWHATVGYFMDPVLCPQPQLCRNCPEEESLGHPTLCSWPVLEKSVLSLTHCHKPALVCHTAVVKLWHFDESSVSACWYRVYDTIPSPSAIRWHILWNCQNTFEVVQNWVQAATADKKMLLGKAGLTFLIYLTPFNHDRYLLVFPPKLQRNTWHREGLFTCLSWGWNEDVMVTLPFRQIRWEHHS